MSEREVYLLNEKKCGTVEAVEKIIEIGKYALARACGAKNRRIDIKLAKFSCASGGKHAAIGVIDTHGTRFLSAR